MEARCSDFLDLLRADDLDLVLVPAHAARFDTRPDIAYIPIRDGLRRERRFVRRATAETHRIRAFTQIACDVVALSPDPLQG